MFFFKKIMAQFFSPLSIIILILFAGLILLLFTSKNKIGKILVLLGVMIFIFCSFGTTSDILIRPLENKYIPIDNNKFVSSLEQLPKVVVVLGGGHSSSQRLPITSQISSDSLTRLVEGIRIYRKIPGSKLLLSGGSVVDPVPEADVMAQIAMSLGVKEQDIIKESKSRDTKDQAMILSSMLDDDYFILVTSASHMPRTVALFRNLNMKPLPAPTMHLVNDRKYQTSDRFFPSSRNLYKSERAFHEYLGTAWAKLRRQL